jgi:hypothetical protein
MGSRQPANAVMIFPFEGPIAMAAANLFRQLGHNVVCAHSEVSDGCLVNLPYVSAPEFSTRFRKIITDMGVTHVMSPHPVVWSALTTLIAEGMPVTLLEPSPYQSDLDGYQRAWEWADASASILSSSLFKTYGDDLETALAALYSGYFAIPGQNDLVKLESLLTVMARCPVGDIVEIGSLFGRSAYALAYLARFFDIGSVLCIDPWSLQYSQDQGASARLVNEAVNQRDFELVHRAFRINRLTYGLYNLDWLRKPSLDAVRDYTNGTAFTRSHTAGRIALLHVDGNHSLEAVRADIKAWVPSVMPGGWIIIDDYRWAFGSGPKQASEEFLVEQYSIIDTAYCVGDTLYIRLSG